MGTRLSILLWPFRMAGRGVNAAVRRLVPDPYGFQSPPQRPPPSEDDNDASISTLQTGTGSSYIKPSDVSDGAGKDSLTISQLEVRERIQRKEAFVLLDIREPHEVDQGFIPGAVQIPLGQLATRFQELDPGHLVVAYCASGVRSVSAARELRDLGFARVHSLAGGFGRWVRDGGDVARPGVTQPAGGSA